jgi:hypothetical protein
MRRAKLGLLIAIGLIGGSVSIASSTASPQKKGLQSRLTAYRGNHCVACHANLNALLRMMVKLNRLEASQVPQRRKDREG